MMVVAFIAARFSICLGNRYIRKAGAADSLPIRLTIFFASTQTVSIRGARVVPLYAIVPSRRM
jgi:hypothetical protein